MAVSLEPVVSRKNVTNFLQEQVGGRLIIVLELAVGNAAAAEFVVDWAGGTTGAVVTVGFAVDWDGVTFGNAAADYTVQHLPVSFFFLSRYGVHWW